MKLLLILILLIIMLLILINNYKIIMESFIPNENNYNYTSVINKYCLVTKVINKDGGKYKSELKSGKLPQLLDNQKIISIDNDFTEDICLNKKFGSGRQQGGFVCMDFLTEKMAKKYNLKYSNKTCYDTLDFKPVYPNYQKHINN